MPRIALLYSQHNRVLQCLSSPETLPLLSYLKEWLVEVELKLKKSSDINEVKFCQGQLDVLERIMNLKEELRSYGDKLIRGEVKKVEIPNGLVKV